MIGLSCDPNLMNAFFQHRLRKKTERGASLIDRLRPSVLTDLKNHGIQDILIACVDGLNGFPDAIADEYPETQIQHCIVHMLRNSLKYVSWTDYKAVTADLKKFTRPVRKIRL
jgi:hypothetical protein